MTSKADLFQTNIENGDPVKMTNEFRGEKCLSDEELDKMSLTALVLEHGKWCESRGYADAACCTPYPTEQALMDRFQAAEQRDRLYKAIMVFQARELNQQLNRAGGG